jgi:hypothetical protein
MGRWSVFLLLLLATCGGHYGRADHDGRKITHVVSWTVACDDFSEVDRDFIREGFAYWEGLAASHLFQEMSCVERGNGISGFLVHRVDRDYFDGTLSYEYDRVPEGHWVGSIALLPPWFSDDDWLKRQVIRHEVGHLLGFAHVDDPGCIMNPEAVSDEACGAELETIRSTYGGDDGQRRTQVDGWVWNVHGSSAGKRGEVFPARQLLDR